MCYSSSMSNVIEMVRVRLSELHRPPDGPYNVQLGIRVDEVNAAVLDYLATKLGFPSRASVGRFLLEGAMADALEEMELSVGFNPNPVLVDGDDRVVVQLTPPHAEP
jgi:hypothetical protein